MVIVAIFTGLRRGELFKLKWADINFENQTIPLKGPKGGKTTVLQVSDFVLEQINKLPRANDLVFPGKSGKTMTDIRKSWKSIKKAAGLPPDLRFTGLRHHFASALVSSGVNLQTVGTLLTHKDIKTTQRYAHLMPGVIREAVNNSVKIIKSFEDDQTS